MYIPADSLQIKDLENPLCLLREFKVISRRKNR
jgi:hypothetical protein